MRKVLVGLSISSFLVLSALGQLSDPGRNGLLKRTGVNASDIAIPGTDYQLPITPGTGIIMIGNSLASDTAYLLTQSTAQASTPLKCTDIASSGSSYSCGMRPALRDYVDKQLVIFAPATACAGGPTLLNINGLGAKPIFKIDGTMNPSANDCRAGQPMLLLYNAALNGGNGAFEIASNLQNSPASLNVGTAIASAATIAPTAPLTHVTGTAQLNHIAGPRQFAQSGFGGCLRFIPDGAFTTGTSGNIATASNAVVSRTLEMCYDNATAKWYPSY